MNKRYEVIDHTADKGIRAYGHDLKELFENAAYGMFSLMADVDEITPTVTREIDVVAPDLESLLKTWLAELLYQFEVDEILFVKYDIKTITDMHVIGTVSGIPFNSDIDWLGSAVKAVTHHDLYVHQVDGKWEAQVILDV